MAGGSDSQRMMLKVCYQAYRRHLSHKEIAANLGISRFQVARLLRAAHDAGYISVNILEPERWHSGLEAQLEERLGLKAVFIVDGEDVEESELQSRVGDAAGRYLLEQNLDGAVIGRQSLIGAKALVTQGTKIPPGSLVLGAPAKVVRKLTKEERAGLKWWAEKYVDNGAYCLKHGIGVGGPMTS